MIDLETTTMPEVEDAAKAEATWEDECFRVHQAWGEYTSKIWRRVKFYRSEVTKLQRKLAKQGTTIGRLRRAKRGLLKKCEDLAELAEVCPCCERMLSERCDCREACLGILTEWLEQEAMRAKDADTADGPR